MRIVLINRFFFPDHSATSQILSDLAQALAQDKPVSIITSRNRYDDASVRLPASAIWRKVNIVRVFSSRFGRGNLFGRAVDYISFYWFAFFRLLIHLRRGDILVAKSDPPLLSVVAGWAARIRSANLISWHQDLFPEIAIEAGILKPHSAMTRLLLGVRDRTAQCSLMNVAISEAMAQRLRDRGIPDDRIRVIHNWAVHEELPDADSQSRQLRSDWGLPDEALVIGYSGNMGKVHALDALIQAARKLDAQGVNARFLLIGDGPRRVALQQAAADLPNVVFRPYQAQERLAISLRVADLHVVSIRAEMEGLVLPSKLYGVLAVGRPVLALGAASGEIGQLISSSGAGITAPADNSDAIATTIAELADDRQRLAAMSAAASRLHHDQFTPSGAINAWQTLLLEARQRAQPMDTDRH